MSYQRKPEFVVPKIEDSTLTPLLDNVKNSITVDAKEMGITLKPSMNAGWHVQVLFEATLCTVIFNFIGK